MGRVSYSVSASRVRNSQREEETRYYLSFSLPLSVFDNNAYLSTGLSATDSHYQQSTVSLSGNALESNRLSYSLSGSNRSGGDNMASVNAAYRTRVSTLGASYSEGNDYRQSGLSARGSPVAIPWHVLASNEIGNTMTVVEAPQAEGLMVNGDESIVTNAQGRRWCLMLRRTGKIRSRCRIPATAAGRKSAATLPTTCRTTVRSAT